MEIKSFLEFLEESKGMMGINVRNDKDIPYADHIVDGKKKYETRNTHSLKSYVGKRVGIVRTGAGKAKAIGEVTLGEPIVVGEEEFEKRRHEHLVPKGSKFDIKPGGTKHLYPIHEPKRYETEKNVGHGIISRKIHENLEESFNYIQDNPGGDWEKNKQARAEKHMKDYKGEGSYGKGLSGDVTGSIRGARLPVDHIHNLPGAENEHLRDLKIDDWAKQHNIQKRKDFNTEKNPILIGVNHKGEAHILEGNHRVKYAHRNGHPFVHAEINYFNGGEKVNSPWHPDKIKDIHREKWVDTEK